MRARKKVKEKVKGWQANFSGLGANYRPSFCLLPFTFFLLIGCADTSKQPTSRPLSARDRQNEALRDPFAYGPGEAKTQSSAGEPMPDVSGGGTADLDKKGLKRDLNRVFNP